MEKVLVTGATGFVALHCVRQLLDKGYEVRGTVRSQKRTAEVVEAMKKAGAPADNLEIVEADLLQDDGWDAAVAGCTYVLHVASPFIVEVPKHEDELIRPAVEGTERVLQAAIRAGVKKTVVTSSCAAINSTHDGKTVRTEKDWTDANHSGTSAYSKSKTLAERRAWEIADAQSGENRMQLAVINPAGIIGPMLSEDIGTSNVFLNQIISGEVPGCPKMHLGFVDVRDVANAHILAMENDAANGHRFIINEREFWFKEVADLMRENGYSKAPSRVLPNFLVRLLGYVKPELKQLAVFIGRENSNPNDKAKEILGWKPRNAGESLLETARQLVEMGQAKV
ncbi:MAG: aldehyde reductase [Parvularculales bacterium]